MMYVAVLVLYFVARYYLKNMLMLLFYTNIALVILFTLILCVAGPDTAVPYGAYSFFLFILMFLETSISFFKK